MKQEEEEYPQTSLAWGTEQENAETSAYNEESAEGNDEDYEIFWRKRRYLSGPETI